MQNILLKKGFVVVILTLIVGIFVIPSMVGTIVKKTVPAENKISVMNLNYRGNIYYVGGTGGGNYTNIQDAINDASNGDTVFVFDDSSPYYENIIVDKSINLIGEDRNTTIIDGSGIDDVIRILTREVNISGLKIRNSGTLGDAGINIQSNNNIISGNTISPNNFYGINLYYSNNNLILDNIISSNNLYAIILSSSNNNNISSNTIISNNNSGIYLSSSGNNTIGGNNISSNSEYGIVFSSSSNNSIIGNTIGSNDKQGLILYPFSNDNFISGNIISFNANHGIQLSSSNVDNMISGNTISFNNNNGIYISSSRNTTINGNNINSNKEYGIYLFSSNNNIISNNNISSNDKQGIILYSLSNNNIISDNTINANNLYAIFLSSSNNNNISGNTIISNNNSGIYLSSSGNNTIGGNNISSNSEYGIVFSSSSNNSIIGNTIGSNDKQGIILYPFSNDNFISGNIISFNANHGIQLSSSNVDNMISGNTISFNNNNGIYLGYSINNTLKNNNISSNSEYGIYLSSSNNNIIYNNYFNNTNNAYDDRNNSWNITKILEENIIGGPYIGGNYWSDYMGIDNNGDGLGDTNLPYNGNGNILNGGDWLPLIFWQDKEPPEIIDNTLGTGYTGDLFTYNSTITDIGGVFSSWVEYWYGTGLHTNISMNNIAENTWERNIIIDDTLEIMHYIIATQDIALNWNSTAVKNVTINDNDYPEITNVKADPYVIIGEGYVNLSATVIDNIEVDNVYLHIDYPNYIVENFSITQNRTDDTYYSNRSYNMPGNYTFYIWANDTSGNTNISFNYSFELQNNPPIVSFTYTPANPTKKDIIQFNDTSIDPDGYITAWFWDFGDHYFSDLQNPIHRYYIPNLYSVSLTVTDNSGVKNTYEIVINISDVLGFITDLQQGWNTMGLTADTTHTKDDIIIRYNNNDYTWQEAVDEGIILDFIYGWDRINKNYIISNTFDPGYGYWLYTYHECILLRPIT